MAGANDLITIKITPIYFFIIKKVPNRFNSSFPAAKAQSGANIFLRGLI